MSDCPSALQRDRYLHGELEGDAAASTRAHVETCSRCQGWLEEARQREAALMAAADEDALVARVVDRLGTPAQEQEERPSLWGWLLGHRPLVAGLAAACLLVVVVGVALIDRGPGPGPGPAPGPIQIKGTTSVKVFCQRQADGRVVELEPGERAGAGDALRFEVFSSRLRHVLVLALEASDRVTLYAPFDGARSASLEPGATTRLPGSVILEGEADELLVFAFSEEPITAARARAAARRALARAGGRLEAVERLELPGSQHRRLIRKGAGKGP
jgi:hypothetical protein